MCSWHPLLPNYPYINFKALKSMLCHHISMSLALVCCIAYPNWNMAKKSIFFRQPYWRIVLISRSSRRSVLYSHSSKETTRAGGILCDTISPLMTALWRYVCWKLLDNFMVKSLVSLISVLDGKASQNRRLTSALHCPALRFVILFNHCRNTLENLQTGFKILSFNHCYWDGKLWHLKLSLDYQVKCSSHCPSSLHL